MQYATYKMMFSFASAQLTGSDLPVSTIAGEVAAMLQRGGSSSGRAWRDAAAILKDAAEERGMFVAFCGSRQERDFDFLPVFDGKDVRDFRPSDRNIIEDARAWAMKSGRLDAILQTVHADTCSYLVVAR